MKRILWAILIIIAIIPLTSCTNQKENASEVVVDYYESIKSCDYITAYEYLSTESKTEYPISDFIEYYQIQHKGFQLLEYRIIEDIGPESKKTFHMETVRKSVTAEEKIEEYPHIAVAILEDNKYRILLGDMFKVDTTAAYINLAVGNLYSHDKDFDYIAHMSKKALHLDPHSNFAYYHLATAYSLSGKIDDALNVIDEYIDLYPALPENNFILSRMYQLKGLNSLGKHESEKAKEFYKISYEIDPSNENAYRSFRELDK